VPIYLRRHHSPCYELDALRQQGARRLVQADKPRLLAELGAEARLSTDERGATLAEIGDGQ